MARVILGVTGSVAAIRTPQLVDALRQAGHAVRIVATEASIYFFDLGGFPRAADEEQTLYRDRDEWPEGGYHRGDRVLHITLRDWADVLVVAPLDAQTLAKFALGLSDNLLSCLFRAWDFEKPIVLAPAMNTRMWESPVTERHLGQLLADRGEGALSGHVTLAEAPALFARHAPGIVLVPPQSKRLACGDIGTGAMAEVSRIAEAVREWGEDPAVE